MARLTPPRVVILDRQLPLSNQGQLELMKAVLERGQRFRTKVRGHSMSPYIRDGDALTVASLEGELPKVGDVMAFTAPGTGRLVIHRIVAINGDGWLVHGDNCLKCDGVVGRDQIIGRIVRVERQGRDIRIGLGASGRWIARLNRRGGLAVLGALTRVPRRLVSAALQRIQNLRIYRSLGRRIGPRIYIVEAAQQEVAFPKVQVGRSSRRKALGQDHRVYSWVANRGHKAIGSVELVHRWDECSPWSGYWLFSLQVVGRYRGLGIGESLTLKVIEEATRQGAEELMLAVHEDNRSARLLYAKNGFVPTIVEALEPLLEAERRQTGRGRIVMRRVL